MPAEICVCTDEFVRTTNQNKCESPTRIAVDFIEIPIKSEPDSIFQVDDIEVSIVSTKNNLDTELGSELPGNYPRYRSNSRDSCVLGWETSNGW